MKNKGFTLIELLVVISIISLLSTIVMASLNSARAKAQEANIKQNLQSIKTQAELSYNKVGDYSQVATEIAPILARINSNGETAALYTLIEHNYSDDSDISYYNHYAVSVRSNSYPTKKWSISDQYGLSTWDSGLQTPSNLTLAVSHCAIPVGGITGRLPTIEELKSLYNTGGMSSLNQDNDYWSSTEYSSDPSMVWNLTPGGYVVTDFKTDGGYNVLCIR